MTLSTDVFDFKISGDKMAGLEAALNVAILDPFQSRSNQPSQRPVTSWRETEEGTLEFSPYAGKPDDNWNSFLVSPTVNELVRIISEWLNRQDYGNSPDIDGSLHKGWTVTTKSRYYDWEVICVIHPTWIEYHK